jgi:hypothetical protein
MIAQEDSDQSTRVGTGTRQRHCWILGKRREILRGIAPLIDLQRVNCRGVNIKKYSILTSQRNLNFPKWQIVWYKSQHWSSFPPLLFARFSLNNESEYDLRASPLQVFYCVFLPGLRPDGFSHDSQVLKKTRSVNNSAVNIQLHQ